MVVGNMPEAIDFIVVGAGPGGYTAALAAARAGRDVVLIDREGEKRVGGVCLLEGCIPSKALIRLANARYRRDSDAVMGLTYSGDSALDLGRFQAWKNEIVATLGDGVRTSLNAAGVRIIKGDASFVNERTLRVQYGDAPSSLFEFCDLIIATGSTPIGLPILDRPGPRVIDAAGVLSLTELPSRIVIVGAGCIGIELGTALAKLGSAVIIIEAKDRILPGFDGKAVDQVSRMLRRLGVVVFTRATLQDLTDVGVEVDTGRDRETIRADMIVVAIGRRPATVGLGLQNAGIALTDKGYISVGADLRCGAHICAIGDVTAGLGLAHRAAAEANIAVDTLCGQAVRVDHLVPSVVFSDPEIATVGATLEQAKSDYPYAAEATAPLGLAGRSFVEQSNRGFATLVYDDDSRLILGATICGIAATEIITEITVAIEAGLTVDDVSLIIHPHPTINEIIWEAARAV